MTAQVVPFVPRSRIDAVANLDDFIRLARDDLRVFGDDLPWAADIWDISSSIVYAGKKNRVRLRFVANDGAGLRPPWGEFARAYMRYQFAMNPRTGIARKLMAVRLLAEIVERPLDSVTELMADDFERAASVARVRYAGSTAYNAGKDLAELYTFLCDHRLLAAHSTWRNSVPRPPIASGHIRVGRDFETRRNNRMPDPSALDAIPRLYRYVTEPGDVMLTSILALLHCAPMRISELLALPVNCEHREEVNGESMYGLRWWPRKGAPPQIKWIPRVMADLARDAVARIRALSVDGRKLAKWDGSHSQPWLPPSYAHLRGATVTVSEMAGALGYTSNTVTSKLAKLGVPPKDRKALDFDRIAPQILPPVPRGFPVLDRASGLQYDSALFAVPYGFGDLQHPPKNWPSAIDQGWIERRIAPPPDPPDRQGFFERHGVMDGNGEPLRVTSHQFRHWLNTLARRGGLGELDIAAWSGRANVRQNEAYDHISAGEIQDAVRAIRQRDMGSLQIVGAPKLRPPVDRKEFLEAKYPAAHTTDYGMCVHDFSLLPCQQHGDCVNCNEHVVVKGAPEQYKGVLKRLEEAQALRERADAGATDGTYGAGRWAEHHARTVARLEAMRAVHENDSIPMGALVDLPAAKADSEIHHALRRRGKTG
jgi:hypothetical protein